MNPPDERAWLEDELPLEKGTFSGDPSSVFRKPPASARSLSRARAATDVPELEYIGRAAELVGPQALCSGTSNSVYRKPLNPRRICVSEWEALHDGRRVALCHLDKVIRCLVRSAGDAQPQEVAIHSDARIASWPGLVLASSASPLRLLGPTPAHRPRADAIQSLYLRIDTGGRFAGSSSSVHSIRGRTKPHDVVEKVSIDRSDSCAGEFSRSSYSVFISPFTASSFSPLDFAHQAVLSPGTACR